ncbi:MAG: hypothetical protein M3512_18120 [Bacteroidota bacterium]|nr:hypothetical protein [Bacteroidota bacterium]
MGWIERSWKDKNLGSRTCIGKKTAGGRQYHQNSSGLSETKITSPLFRSYLKGILLECKYTAIDDVFKVA